MERRPTQYVASANTSFRLVLAACVLIAPLALARTVHAQEVVQAGFGQGSLWTSSNAITEGDSVQVSTLLVNSSGTSVSATVVFEDATSTMSTAHVTLAPHTSQIATVPWTPKEGTHLLHAQITKATVSAGRAILQNATTGASIILVAAKPVIVVEAPSTLVESMRAVASSTPVVGNVANAIISATEKARLGAESFLTNQITSAASSSTPRAAQTSVRDAASSSTASLGSSVLGAQIELADDASAGNSNKSTHPDTIITKIELLLLTLVRSTLWFYLLILALFVGGMYLLLKRLRNPKR